MYSPVKLRLQSALGSGCGDIRLLNIAALESSGVVITMIRAQRFPSDAL